MSFTEVQDTIVGSSEEQKLQAAQEIVAGNVPLIGPPPGLEFTLPRGYHVGGSKWDTDVVLRELNGSDEETLASRAKDAAEFLDVVVTLGVARIGSTDLTEMTFSERQAILSSLLVGEREQLFLNIARVTYGDEKEISHTCPNCGVSIETTLLLSEDIKCREMENPYKLSWTHTTAHGDVFTYQLVTGADTADVIRHKTANVAEQNTYTLARVITMVNGQMPLDPMATARSLSMGDRHRILDDLVTHQPSPDLSIKVPCFSCEFEMVLALTWGDIFRP